MSEKSSDLTGWEVVSVEHCPLDKNYKAVVKKGKQIRDIYFYAPVRVGDIVTLCPVRF